MWGRGTTAAKTDVGSKGGLGQEEVIGARGPPPPRRRPGAPGLERWPAMSMTGKSPDGLWAPRICSSAPESGTSKQPRAHSATSASSILS